MFKKGARGPGESGAACLAQENEWVVAPLNTEYVSREGPSIGLSVKKDRNVTVAVGNAYRGGRAGRPAATARRVAAAVRADERIQYLTSERAVVKVVEAVVADTKAPNIGGERIEQGRGELRACPGPMSNEVKA